jgi:calcineurin-like phosphoesterase family protein
MDEALIKNWNKRVAKGDVVYHLGDFGFGRCLDVLDRLNGIIILIEGSHDSHIMRECEGRFFQINKMRTITILKQEITLCHYAMRRWPKSHYGSWHLYGHSHGKLPPYGKSFDVGVDCNGFSPISFFEIQTKMDLLKNQGEEAVI